MGRKVHPVGFRLGIIKTWEGRWFANSGRYADQLHEDLAIRKLVETEAPRAGISRIEIERYATSVVITIHTARPGVVIGRRGESVKKMRQKLEQLTGSRVKVEVEEISQPDLDARLVAENVAGQLERRIGHSRAMKRAISQAMRQGAQGIKIVCSGRLAGSEMARRDWMRDGRVPLQTLRADIDFAHAEALTTFGRIGVKVWIYKGEVLPERAEQATATDVYVSQ